MKVAVLYTGALRTIRKTIAFFKQNVLLHSDVHIFACLQNDTSTSNQEIQSWLQQELKMHLRALKWFDLQDHSELIILREKNLAHTTIPNKWKDYLRNSGSILEYFQLHMAYQQMNLYEETRGISYDYVIKMRPDNLFAKPIDFHWLQWNPSQIEERVYHLHEQMKKEGIDILPESTLRYFMNTLLDDQLLLNLSNMIGQFISNKRVSIPSSAKELHDYLHQGSYILTYRTNNLYIVRRELFHLIPSLFGMYGLFKRPDQDNYWFNAENQFQNACYHSGLAIHDYNTLFEDKSLYEYEESRYFDSQYRIINPMMVYCLVRH